MSKHALIEINLGSLRLTTSNVRDGETFFTTNQYVEEINFNDAIKSSGLVPSEKIAECVGILKMFKKICVAEGVEAYHAVATGNLMGAKNYQSFIDEAGHAIGLKFDILTPEEGTACIYSAVVNTLDVPKGIIVSVSTNSTRLIHYNRRVVLEGATIPLGSSSLFEKTQDVNEAVNLIKEEILKLAPFIQGQEETTPIVGVGETFKSFVRLSRKMKRYPVGLEHNFVASDKDFDQVFNFIKDLEPDKKQKIKGISSLSSADIIASLCIVKAVLEVSKLNTIITSVNTRSNGVMFHKAIPYTLERPVHDVLTYGLDTIAAQADLDRKHAEQLYSLALMLFKQLKVLHKLPRSFAKILRIATWLYHIGRHIDPLNFRQINYHAIINTTVYGATHRETILAAFCASIEKWEDFNLHEWVKYKDILTDEDLEAVRKISNIISIAAALNLRAQHVIKDITCDVLGESVILKLVTELDPKSTKIDPLAAKMEIFYANKYTGEFYKAFKKNLEIL